MSRKKRTRSHVIADLKMNFVERRALLCGFVVERRYSDYGYDRVLYSDTLFVLPNYQEGELVAWYHLTTVRWLLDERGLMTSSDFDRFTTATTATA